MTELDLEPFIDAVAQSRFEAYDSHFHNGSFTWEKYKAEEPSDTEALYLQEARRDVHFALPALAKIMEDLVADRPGVHDEDDREWVKTMQRELVPKIDGSAFVASLVPASHGLDVKFAVELGVSIMLDKPILAVMQPGCEASQKLLKVADRVIELPGELALQQTQEYLSQQITLFGEEFAEPDAAGEEEPGLGTSDSPREDAPEGTHEGTSTPPLPLLDDDDVDGPQ